MFYYRNKPFATPTSRMACTASQEVVNLDANPQVESHTISFTNMGDKLIRRIKMVRGVDQSELPTWLGDQPVVHFYNDVMICIEMNESGKIQVNPGFNIENLNESQYIIPWDDYSEIMEFALGILFKQNKYLYALFHDASIQAFKYQSFADKWASGMLDLICNPKKQSQIESLAKTISPVFALESVKNGIECTNSKKALVLPYDMLHQCKTMQLDESIPFFQELVQDGILSVEQMGRFLDGLRYLIKFKMAKAHKVRSLFSTGIYQETIKNRKINLDWLLQMVIKNIFLTCNLHNSTPDFVFLVKHYLDAVQGLPEGKFSTNNIEVFHIISTRNKEIFKNPRPEEFKKAAERLRKLNWKNDEYIISPMQTEEELFYVGERYNNCLPIYRDKIIDDGAVVMCVYENEEGTKAICPVVVFETTARLDILQVKTFNDDDVTDKNLLKVVSEWKEAKRYLLSKGRTVYRELEEDESADIENSSDSNS